MHVVKHMVASTCTCVHPFVTHGGRCVYMVRIRMPCTRIRRRATYMFVALASIPMDYLTTTPADVCADLRLHHYTTLTHNNNRINGYETLWEE